MTELRDYQQQAIADLRRSLGKGNRRPLFVLPTGGGKTAVAAELVRAARAKCNSVLFLAPRRELIYQASERLSGIDHSIIMAGEPGSLMPSVQVACIPTLHARCFQRQRMMLPRAQLVIVDESHIGVGGRAQSIIEHYADAGAVVVGLTATPARSDGRGLGMVYDDMVEGPTVRELTEAGYLVPSRYFTGAKPDLEGVKVQAGDYHQGELAERTDKPTLVGDVVTNWARLAGDRQTFVFAVNVAHSRHLASRFKAVGVSAEHIDGKTDLDERKAIQQRLRDGVTQVVVNCQVMTYGVDFPPVSCIVLAAPTKSITKYMQMVGRGLRTFDDKRDCMVLDHAGAVREIGFVDDPMPWTLDGRDKIQDRKEREQKETREPKEIACRECETVFRAARECPGCGHEMVSAYEEAMQTVDADLVEIDRARKAKQNREWGVEQKAAFFGELKRYAANKGYAPGWAAHKYRERFSVWPNDPRVKSASPAEPSRETLGWITSRNIARAKQRGAA